MMTRTTSLALLLIAPLALGACMTAQEPAPQVAASAKPAEPSAFIEAACGGCHAVQPPFLSPNPAAPTFESIANRPGVSEDKIAKWLIDAHNYPEVMDFDLKPERVDEIASYMITLQRDDYKPDI